MKPDLPALLGSRICHDLISPLGAIGNGVELLMMTGAAAGPEMTLIAESVANAHARIRFFRVSFGGTAASQRMGRPEILGILQDITKGTRLSIDWQVAGDLSRDEVKLAFLVIQCCEAAMPYGGKITLERGDSQWRVVAAATKLKVDAGLFGLLAGDALDRDLTASEVQFALVPETAARLRRKLAVELRETSVRLEF